MLRTNVDPSLNSEEYTPKVEQAGVSLHSNSVALTIAVLKFKNFAPKSRVFDTFGKTASKSLSQLRQTLKRMKDSVVRF